MKKIRESAIAAFTKLFKKKKYAKELEKVVFKGCTTTLEYSQTVRRILFNATKKELPETLLHRSTAEWLALNQRTLYTALKKAEEKKIEALERKMSSVSTADSLIQCRFCKKNAVSYTQKQTRSADEPMTLFYACSACDRRWRG